MSKAVLPAMPPEVAEVFATYPAGIRTKLLEVRRLLFETAATTDGVGPVTETLRWAQPAYLTEMTRSGSTIRLGWKPSAPEQYAVYVHCRTTLVETFRTLCHEELTFDGNRAILLNVSEPVPEQALATLSWSGSDLSRLTRPAQSFRTSGFGHLVSLSSARGDRQSPANHWTRWRQILRVRGGRSLLPLVGVGFSCCLRLSLGWTRTPCYPGWPSAPAAVGM